MRCCRGSAYRYIALDGRTDGRTQPKEFPLYLSITGTLMSKSSCWSVTINNPNDDDNAAWTGLAANNSWVKEVKGQLEEGENGTPHIQGYVKTEYGRFFQKLRAALPRAHIEVAKNQFALEKYVQKEETRIGAVASVKTATQSDLQYEMVSLLMYSTNMKYITQKNWDKSYDAIAVNILNNAEEIRQFWEPILDDAVKSLINKGYYGVEFVVSNNQVRSAFKRYLPEILYRAAKEYF